MRTINYLSKIYNIKISTTVQKMKSGYTTIQAIDSLFLKEILNSKTKTQQKSDTH